VPATAVVAATDSNAAGLTSVLRQSGRQLPEALAVVGFDDSDEDGRNETR
jgi:DNA-binding LacI/PurR family transcriptional regulator